jgi:hypothetical protein
MLLFTKSFSEVTMSWFASDESFEQPRITLKNINMAIPVDLDIIILTLILIWFRFKSG